MADTHVAKDWRGLAYERAARRPTLRDVAALAGVSIQTVSNVIHGRTSEMTAETHERVQSAMLSLDYQVDRRAAALRSGRTQTIAVLVLDEHAAFLADPLTSMIIAGVGDVARDNEYAVLIQGARPSARSGQLLTPLREGRVDGAVVQLSGDPDLRTEQTAAMTSLGLPIVVMDELTASGAVATVRADQRGGSRLLTEHLISRGQRRIAFIGAAAPWAVVEQRAQGYRDALAAAGIEFDTSLLSLDASGYDAQYGAEIARRLLGRSEPPTGILCASDLLALGALEAARDLGLNVPEEVAIAGFDDFNFAAHVQPSLTTVSIPGYEMGKRAATLLLEAISHSSPTSPNPEFPTSVIVRKST